MNSRYGPVTEWGKRRQQCGTKGGSQGLEDSDGDEIAEGWVSSCVKTISSSDQSSWRLACSKLLVPRGYTEPCPRQSPGWEIAHVSSVPRRKQEMGLGFHKPALHRRQGSSSSESAGAVSVLSPGIEGGITLPCITGKAVTENVRGWSDALEARDPDDGRRQVSQEQLSVLLSGTVWSLVPSIIEPSSSLTTPSRGLFFSVCNGRGPALPKAACNHLGWAGWARLGGGEVGQLVAMVTAAAPCQPSHLFTTNLTHELFCPV